MKQLFIFEKDDMHRLKNNLRDISQSLSAIEKYKDNDEYLKLHLSIIQERTEKAINLIKE